MKGSDLSIRTTLLLIISVLNLMIAVLVGFGVYRSWTRYAEAQTLQQSSMVINYIFRAQKYLSLERSDSVPIVYTARATTANLLDELISNRLLADGQINRVFSSIGTEKNPAVADTLSKVRRQYIKLQAIRYRIDQTLIKTPDQRPEHLSDDAFDATTDLVMSLKELLDSYTGPSYDIDPVVTQQIRFKYFIWEITEYAGREYALMGKLIVENRRPTPAQQEKLYSWRARVEHGWEIDHVLLRTSHLERTLGSYMSEAETHYFVTFDQIKDMFYSPAAVTPGASYPINIELWLELASQAVDSLVSLKDMSLNETQRYVDKIANDAQRSIIESIVLLACAALLTVYSWTIIVSRVLQPVNAMVTALYRATRGESYVPPPVTNRHDEIGKLALVLQAFQENVRRIRQTSIELEERKNYLNAVLSTMIDGILAIDEAGTIQLVNKAIERMFGYGDGELLGKNATILMPASTDAPPRLYLEPFMVVRKEKYAERNREAMARRKDGYLFPVEMVVTEMKTGGVAYFVGTLRDITERKIAEEEHERYLRDLENSNRELDDFAYIASHDLKEPLRGLHNFSKFLLEDYSDRLDDEGRNMLNTLASLTQQMEGLLNALLHYSRLGRTEMSIRETDLNQIVQNVLQMFSIRIKETGAVVDIPRKLPQVTCDHVRIAEVFQNLIGNALKYHDGKNPKIEIGCTRAHPNHQGENVFYVKDNGIGIAEKNLDSIFKIFHRLHPRNAYGGGTGSGLTITKKIVNRHGGEIWAESAGKGEGTTFYFTLPQHAHDGKAASSAEAAFPGGTA